MIKTFIKPMIYDKNRSEIVEQIAGGAYKNFDYYVLNLKNTLCCMTGHEK